MVLLNNINKLNRSELAVPACRKEFFEKAAKSNSDIVFLDLEDSVSYNEKDKARKFAVEAINDIEWGNKVISVRVNGFNTGFIKDDIEFIVSNASKKLDLLMIPKIEKAEDIQEINELVSRFEDKEADNKIGFELIIETALGLINIEKLATACERNESLHFGSADLAASIGAKVTNIGGMNCNYGVLEESMESNKNKSSRNFYLNDMWHYASFKILLTAKAFDLRAIDCPYGNFKDSEGFIASAKKSYSLGFDGKMVIHPDQIDLANKIYAPTLQEIDEAKNILDEMEKANENGKGAVAINGKLLDIVSIKQAKNILDTANKVSEKDIKNDENIS